ncbi:MAG: DUF3592 domain-containing protein [Thermoanaerobaculia bacterium]
MTKTSRGLGCLVLFALPFAGAGLFVMFLAARMLWGWYEAQSWVETPARIISTDLQVNTGSDSTTFKAVASYEYTWAGTPYVGRRVSLSPGADNIGSFHQDRQAELARYRESGELFRCYVDADEPSRSILYREMRLGMFTFLMLFGGVFAGVGFGLMGAGFLGKRKVQEEEQLASQHPEDPWRWKPEWADGRITASGRAGFVLPGIMALFWNLVSLPLLFVLPEEIFEKGNRAALLGFIFPLVGLGLLVWAGRAFLRWKKYADSVFEMSKVPGVVGGKLEGRILTSVNIETVSGFDLTLNCVHRVTKGSGDSRSTTESILWQERQHIERELLDYDPTRSSIPVLFAIAYDTQPTEERSDDDEILWRLELEAETPGIDYAAKFQVPVFKTADSRRDFELQDSPQTSHLSAQDPITLLATESIRKEFLPTGGYALIFPAARHKGAALGLTAFFALWTAITFFLFVSDAPLLFPIVFALFDLLMLWAVLDIWLDQRRVEVRPDRLLLSGGILGQGKTNHIPRTQITAIRPIRGMQAGNKLYYRIEVTTQDGKKHLAASKLGGLTLARQVVEEMQGLGA